MMSCRNLPWRNSSRWHGILVYWLVLDSAPCSRDLDGFKARLRFRAGRYAAFAIAPATWMRKRDVPDCTCDGRCAEGTSQIAHRKSLAVLILFPYVRFGTSLLHIESQASACWRIARRLPPRRPFACSALAHRQVRDMDERCDSTASWPEPEAEAMAYGREARTMRAGGIRHWPKMTLRLERGC